MAFGTYDESEQESQDDGDIGDDDGISVHEYDHDGEVRAESDADPEELVDQLQEIK